VEKPDLSKNNSGPFVGTYILLGLASCHY